MTMEPRVIELERSFVGVRVPADVIVEAIQEASAEIGVQETLRALCPNHASTALELRRAA